MEDHHRASIDNVIVHFTPDPEVELLLLGGSLAHGFATPQSDVDVLLIVSDDVYQHRLEQHQVHFFSRELCTYPEGYVDGKYCSHAYLEQVRAQGSEPARFAFQDARPLLARTEALNETLLQIPQYPRQHKADRLRRFYAQFEAWAWYTQEAFKHENRYLLGVAVSKLILFGGRLILAHNERLYPYHKWFLRVLAQAPDRPADLLEQIEALARQPDAEAVARFCETIRAFRPWEAAPGGWPTQFMQDSELNWLDGHTPVDDL